MNNKAILERLKNLENLVTQKEQPTEKRGTISFKRAIIEFLKISLLVMQIIHQLV